MSFSKKTWVDRVAESPLRRFLTIIRPDDGSGTFVADIERDEGTVTTEGDAFSAANMNDLETRIKNAFDDAGGGNFVGVRYHSSLATYPGYPCWEDMTAAQRAKYDYSTGAIVTFIDEDMPDDIIGTTDISGIADGTLTGAIDKHEDDIDTLNATLDNRTTWTRVGNKIGTDVITLNDDDWYEIFIKVVDSTSSTNRTFTFFIIRGPWSTGNLYVLRDGYYYSSTNYMACEVAFKYVATNNIEIYLSYITLNGTNHASTADIDVFYRKKQ